LHDRENPTHSIRLAAGRISARATGTDYGAARELDMHELKPLQSDFSAQDFIRSTAVRMAPPLGPEAQLFWHDSSFMRAPCGAH
jgi:hypothetical protein